MMPSTARQRRKLLRALAGLATAGLGWPLARRARAAGAPDTLRAALASCIESRTSARHVGLAYLAQVPAERDAELLVRRICAGKAWCQWSPMDYDEPMLKRRLAAQIRRDFAEHRTVNLRGWVMSQTEARLCALIALG